MRFVGFLCLSAAIVGCATNDRAGGADQRAPVRESSVYSTDNAEPELVRVEEPVIRENAYETAQNPEVSQEPGQTLSQVPDSEGVEQELASVQEITGELEDPLKDLPTDQQVSSVPDSDLPSGKEGEVVVADLAGVSEPQDVDTEDADIDASGVDGLVQVPLKDPIVDVVEEVDESEVVGYLLDEAEQSFDDGNLSKAKGQAERAIALEPTAGRSYLILAEIALKEKKPDAAAEAVREGLASVSDSDEVFDQLNEVLGRIAELRKTAGSN